MGDVVRGPWRRHARASARSARRVKSSAVSPAEIALSVESTEAHQLAGMLSRWNHFVTITAVVPTSEAIDARESPQSSTTSLNDVIFAMGEPIGHLVLERKANLSLDCGESLGHNVRMAKRLLTDFECRFLARTCAARKLAASSQDEFAGSLQDGMKQDHYKQFETRSMLPHHLIDRFLKLTGVGYEWLFTGRGAGPAWQDRYQELLAKQVKPKKVRKAA